MEIYSILYQMVSWINRTPDCKKKKNSYWEKSLIYL